MTQKHDVIVVGAGPAGSATAYFLAKQGADVLLLDKSEFPRDKTCGDAISPRALHVINQMGLLDELTVAAHCVHSLHLYAPNGVHIETPVPAETGMPDYTLVVPRLQLDVRLQSCAIEAGAQFQGEEKVIDLLRLEEAVVGVRTRTRAGEQEYIASGVVIATGAAMRVMESADLLPSKPSLMLAARTYFEDVSDIRDQIEFYFNDVALPGYGWMFPTGPTSANVGVGYIGKLHSSPRVAFDKLIEEHPRLQEILSQARGVGPVKSFPLRVDFHKSQKTAAGLIAVGEAVGLVNPYTGEGIDYALESGQIAAKVVGALLQRGMPWTVQNLEPYVQTVNARFQKLFVLMTRARGLYYNPHVLNRIFGGGRQALVKTLVEIAFSNANPALAFRPRTLWEIARP